jgi:hypothetical protein
MMDHKSGLGLCQYLLPGIYKRIIPEAPSASIFSARLHSLQQTLCLVRNETVFYRIARFFQNFKNAEALVGRWNEVRMNPKRFTVESNWIHRMGREHEDKMTLECWGRVI